jgi:hypothetical protein
MAHGPEQLAARYAAMSEVELLELAQDYDALTDSAKTALRAEFARRNLEPPLVEDRAEPASRDMVTVHSYRDLAEAIVARSLLEAEGIEAWVRDENLVRLDWMYSNAVGGIRLQVDARNATAADDILGQLPTSIPFAENAEYVQPQCSQCGSSDLSLLPMIPLWRCNGCGARGNIVEDDAPENPPPAEGR